MPYKTRTLLEAVGAPLNHIKPHGALFGMTSKYEHFAEAAADAAEVFGVPLIGQAGTMHDTVYSRRSLPWNGPSSMPIWNTTGTATSSSRASTSPTTRRLPPSARSARSRRAW